MLKTSSPQDAIVLLDDCTPVTATAVGGITWGKTGLTYVSLAGIGVLTVSPSGVYNVVQNYEFSNDLTNWKSAPMQNDSSVPLAENTAVTGSGSAAMTINCKGWLYFRVTITTYTSGTYNCRIVGRAGTATPGTLPVAAIQDGTWTVQPGNTANTTPWLVTQVPTFTNTRVAADGQIRSSAGRVHTVSIAPITATPTAGLITVYDSPTESGTKLYEEWCFATTVGHTITLDTTVANGIYVGYDATAANFQVTVSHSS